MPAHLDKSYADKLDRDRELAFQGHYPCTFWIVAAALCLERLESVGVSSGAVLCQALDNFIHQ